MLVEEVRLIVRRPVGPLSATERVRYNAILRELRTDIRRILNATRARVRAAAPRRTGLLRGDIRVSYPSGGPGVVVGRIATTRRAFYANATNARGRHSGWWDAAVAGLQGEAEAEGAQAERQIDRLELSIAERRLSEEDERDRLRYLRQQEQRIRGPQASSRSAERQIAAQARRRFAGLGFGAVRVLVFALAAVTVVTISLGSEGSQR